MVLHWLLASSSTKYLRNRQNVLGHVYLLGMPHFMYFQNALPFLYHLSNLGCARKMVLHWLLASSSTKYLRNRQNVLGHVYLLGMPHFMYFQNALPFLYHFSNRGCAPRASQHTFFICTFRCISEL